VTTWSEWTRIISNDDIITEKRTRFVCEMPSLSNQQSLEIKSDKTIYRVCNNTGNDCQETGKSSK
jgi:hypothetical protein